MKVQEVKERINTHFKEYKTLYLCLGSGIVFAGITTVIMRGRYASLGYADEGEDLILNKSIVRPLNFFSNKSGNTNIVNVLEREGRGHPGYMVYCYELDEAFPSQTNISKILDIPESVISDHLRGKFDHANGYHLKRVQPYAA